MLSGISFPRIMHVSIRDGLRYSVSSSVERQSTGKNLLYAFSLGNSGYSGYTNPGMYALRSMGYKMDPESIQGPIPTNTQLSYFLKWH